MTTLELLYNIEEQKILMMKADWSKHPQLISIVNTISLNQSRLWNALILLIEQESRESKRNEKRT